MKIAGDEVEKLFIGFLSGTILIIIYSAIKHSLTFPPIKGLAGAIYVGIFEMGLTFIFWLKALKYSKTTAHISNLVFLSPFLSLFYINFILKERIMLSTITIGSSTSSYLSFYMGNILDSKYEDSWR